MIINTVNCAYLHNYDVHIWSLLIDGNYESCAPLSLNPQSVVISTTIKVDGYSLQNW